MLEVKFRVPRGAQEVKFVLPRGTKKCPGGKIWGAQRCQ